MVSSTQARGQAGEQIARRYLEQHGFRFITANWRCKVGEIDLIMQDGSTRVLVEVRLRKPTYYGTGYETVAWQKQQKLLRAARYYQQKEHYWRDLRFDVVSISQSDNQEPHIEHIKDAF